LYCYIVHEGLVGFNQFILRAGMLPSSQGACTSSTKAKGSMCSARYNTIIQFNGLFPNFNKLLLFFLDIIYI
jgi:hypothetical protein